uniref:Maturase MatK N-terminal domain-containing protein n=1 Tax=Hordeum vulgare subsp. vulgare TaxID=112509 RepID=A0A8I6YEJ3_HORVV
MGHFGIMYHGFSRKTLWFFMDPIMHYVWYQGKAILASKGSFLKKKWKCYLINFWQYCFFFLTHPQRIHINQLGNTCFDFMGYLSSVQNKSFVSKESNAREFISHRYSNEKI